MDESRSVQRLRVPLIRKRVLRDAFQVLIHERDHVIESL